jgi:hypothetical protein
MSAAEAGLAASVRITARDVYDNVMTDAAALFDIQVQGPSRVRATLVSELVTGSVFLYNYTPFVVGDYTVSVQRNGVSLIGSPRNITVAPSFASAIRCTAVGDGTTSGTAGVFASLTISVRDSYGNRITRGGDTFLAEIRNPTDARIIVVPDDMGDGTYRLLFGSDISGTHILTITIASVSIYGSPFSVAVFPGPLDAEKSEVHWDSIGEAGRESSVITIARDFFRNLKTDGLSVFTIHLPDGSSKNLTYVEGRYAGFTTPFFRQSYSTTVVFTKSGTYNITVQALTQGGYQALVDSPIFMLISPTLVSSAHCVAFGESTTRADAGINGTVWIQARDRYSNNLTKGEEVFEVTLIGSNPTRSIDVRVTDLLNGFYTANYYLEKTGIYGLRVLRAGVSVIGSPFSLMVYDARTDPTKTVLEGGGLAGCVQNSVCSFSVTLFDIYGNRRSTGGDQVVASVSDEIYVTRPVVTDNGNGRYEVTIRANIVSTYFMSVSVNNHTVAGSPFFSTVVVQPLEPSAKNSRIITPEPLIMTAGVRFTLQLQLRDINGISIVVPELTDQPDYLNWFEVTIENPPGLTVPSANKDTPPGYNPDGTYNIFLPASINQAELYKVHVLVGPPGNQEEIPGSPLNVTVRAADVSASNCEMRPMALGEIYTSAVAGVTGQFLIDVVDAFNNPVFYDPLVDIGISGAVTGTASSTLTLIDQLIGLYEANYVLTVAGEYSVSVTVKDVPVSGSPFTVVVAPNVFSPPACVAAGEGLSQTTLGAPSVFSISAFDQFGNIAETFGAAFTGMAVADPTIFGAEVANVMPENARIVYQDGGQYDGQFAVTRSGQYLLYLMFENTHISGSPFTILAQPLQADSTRSEAQGIGLERAYAGEVADFEVVAKDKYSNRLTAGRMDIAINITGGPYSATANVYDRNDGTFQIFYIADVPRKYNVSIHLNGFPLTGSPFVLEVALNLPPVPIRAFSAPSTSRTGCPATCSLSSSSSGVPTSASLRGVSFTTLRHPCLRP